MKDKMTIYTVTNNRTGIVCFVSMTADEAMLVTKELNRSFTKAVYEYARVDLPVKEFCNYIKSGMNALGE